MQSDVGESVLENMRGLKMTAGDWFGGVEDTAKDLLTKMLVFNPNKRLTI
jgi:hypothetical protein